MWHPIRLVVVGLILGILVFRSEIGVPPAKTMTLIERQATFQQFEHGFMLAVGGSVDVFPYNDLAFGFSKDDIALLEEVPIANGPPARDYQPTGDFGKLWSNSPRIMRALGWAITPPIEYTAAIGAASGLYRSIPVSNYSVKTNPASTAVGGSDTADFFLVNNGILHAGQMLWTYIPPFDQEGIRQYCGTQRIQFQAGGYAAIVEGTFAKAGCSEVIFLVKAMAQQRMSVSVVYQDLSSIGTVVAPDGTSIQMPRNEVLFDGILPATGDYSIHLKPDFSGPEPIFQDKYQNAQYQYSSYSLLVVIR